LKLKTEEFSENEKDMKEERAILIKENKFLEKS